MSDLLLGMIIGGLIGVGGSAITALIQGRYSLKARKEDNLAQQEQQSVKIQYEKDSQIISRRIAIRSRYLEPLNDSLSTLYASIDNYEKKLIQVLHPYYRGRKKYKVKVSEINKREFARQLATTETEHEAISTSRDEIWAASPRVGDLNLIDELTEQTEDVTKFYKGHSEIYDSLNNSKTGQDWVYDFASLLKSMDKIRLDISKAYRRIESLLAGVEEDEE